MTWRRDQHHFGDRFIGNIAEIDYIASSQAAQAAQTAIAENYVGLPL